MKIFVIGSAFPFRTHSSKGVTAINIVTYELIKNLLALNHSVVFQTIFSTDYDIPPELITNSQEELAVLKKQGCKMLVPIFLAQKKETPEISSNSFFNRLLCFMDDIFLSSYDIKQFYPAIKVKDEVCWRIHSQEAEAVLIIWSPEGVAATHGLGRIPRMSYQGDIEFKPMEVRWQYRHSIFCSNSPQAKTSFLSSLRKMRVLERFKKAHLKLIRGLDIVASVTASNAKYYTQIGHKNSIYIGNTWSDYQNGSEVFQRAILAKAERKNRVKIIGHVGNLRATGSSFGLYFLMKDVVPRLNVVMKEVPYELHIIGSGEVLPSIQPFMKQENVIVRGYVHDLDAEFLNSDAFLLLNNVGSYNSAFTRHIIAWSMGLCLIVHEGSLRAIPEIRHMENALVGTRAEDVAELIHQAVTSLDLNERIRKNGRKTYLERFHPFRIAERIDRALCSVLD